MERLGGLESAVVAEGAFSPGPALRVGKREVAHFDGDHTLDVRLTKPAIAEWRPALRADDRVVLRSGSSDWLEFRIGSPEDAEFAFSLVVDAVAANRKTAPAESPPTGAELQRRRGFH